MELKEVGAHGYVAGLSKSSKVAWAVLVVASHLQPTNQMRKLLLGVVCVTSVSSWAVPILDPGTGHYYDVIAAPGITWDDARAQALSSFYLGLRGHLATITSAAEHTYVNLAIIAAGGGERWAGGYQQPGAADSQSGWTWVNNEGSFPGTNSASPYAAWNGGEPNDYYGPNSEQYLGLNLGPGFNDEGNLGLIAGYVIEYDPGTIIDVPIGVPDGGATAALLGFGIAGVALARRKLS